MSGKEAMMFCCTTRVMARRVLRPRRRCRKLCLPMRRVCLLILLPLNHFNILKSRMQWSMDLCVIVVGRKWKADVKVNMKEQLAQECCDTEW
jgi:hypothetical protein